MLELLAQSHAASERKEPGFETSLAPEPIPLEIYDIKSSSSVEMGVVV